MTEAYKTNSEIAGDFYLWGEYFDTQATMSRTEFDALTIDQREQMIEDVFGTDAKQIEQRQLTHE